MQKSKTAEASSRILLHFYDCIILVSCPSYNFSQTYYSWRLAKNKSVFEGEETKQKKCKFIGKQTDPVGY